MDKMDLPDEFYSFWGTYIPPAHFCHHSPHVKIKSHTHTNVHTHIEVYTQWEK